MRLTFEEDGADQYFATRDELLEKRSRKPSGPTGETGGTSPTSSDRSRCYSTGGGELFQRATRRLVARGYR